MILRLWCALTGGHRWRVVSTFYDVQTGVEWTRVECRRCGYREPRVVSA